ncbi:M48 family metallopeptidase [Sulfurimonas sp.]|uniref:M48 family metallopeptidase n=1 Tax=Sulfurimonas sp. TaxID=2022749 RepID=UPI0039E3C32A
MHISQNAEIILKTSRVPHAFVLNLLTERESWIRKKVLEIKKNPPVKVSIADEVLLFGKIYSIDMPEASSLRVKLEKMRAHSVQNTIKYYNSFYKEYSSEYIIPRVSYFSQLMDLEYKTIKFRKMKSRWGSCSSKKELTFNTELIKTKKELIDYVVVHELAHLKHMNHSKAFHDLVENYLPNSKIYRKELKKTKISTF